MLFLFLCLFLLLAGCSPSADEADKAVDWPHYLGDPAVTHYSPLTQITRENVHQLQVAWTYNAGGADTAGRTQIQCNPIVVDGVLYGSSPTLVYFALDAATGRELWRFDPFDEEGYDQFGMGVNRGIAWFANARGEKRLFVTASNFLYCLDAATGDPVPTFGEGGRIDLRAGLGRDVGEAFVVSNTPGVVFDSLYMLGTRVSESTAAAPGHIRAYNVHTGEQAWVFHTIPHPGEAGHETWPAQAWRTSGGANSWAGMSLDTTNGIVYVPTGSASYDFYGADRIGANLYANTILALDARTGERRWHFQTVHHDLWDRDLPCPPTLFTFRREGREVPALAQPTKSGHLFVLNRLTGEPLFPIEERPVPTNTLPGDEASPTQPIPTAPPPFTRQQLTAADLPDRSPAAMRSVDSLWKELGEHLPWEPPQAEGGRILFPGFDGGAEWGGAGYSPELGYLFVNANEVPWLLEMEPYESPLTNTLLAQGADIYKALCITCHGSDRQGASIYTVPPIHDLKDRMEREQVMQTVRQGKGAMPSFAQLGDTQLDALAAFLLEEDDRLVEEQLAPAWPYPYVMGGYTRLKDSEGYPAVKPPWGTLTAIDMHNGRQVWQRPLGEYAALKAQGVPPTGTENYGGPVVTAGGLLFIAATLDSKIRAFDQRTGELLWEHDLPAAGFATPATYSVDGKQYLVIACGGGKLGQPSGDAYVAFALP